MNKIKIKIPEENNYVLKILYKLRIDIYNIEYYENGNIYTIDEKEIENLPFDSYEILSYKGIKNIFHKIKIHKNFLIATLISIFLMIIMSNIIVDVDVIHNDKDIRVLIEDELYDLGIKPLIWKKNYQKIQYIKDKIKTSYPDDIEWLEIIDEGMKYTVRVEERIITKIEQKPEYCNIISTKDATILNMISSSGQTVVDINDYVKKGTILISGDIKFNETTKSHTCAEGTVYGNTWYRIAISIPLAHTKKKYTTKTTYNIGFEFGSTYNRVFKIHFKDYDIEKIKIFSLGRFALYKEKIKEYIPEKSTYTENEALKKALEEARKKLFIKLTDNAEILDEKVLQSNTYNSIMNVEIFYSVKEIISKKVEAEYIENKEE